MDRTFRTTRGSYTKNEYVRNDYNSSDYTGVKNRYMDYSGEQDTVLHSASLVGEERGYVLGVEDEQKKFREKMKKIISNLKARGYPLIDIAQDTGYSLEEIRVI